MGAEPKVPYEGLRLPEPPEGRPYVAINMVATIDGKTVSGGRDDGVMDLGSKADHAAMRNLQSACDAVMIGAQTLRSNPRAWYPAELWRIVATRSGHLDFGSRFFEHPSRVLIACPEDAEMASESGFSTIRAGRGSVDFAVLLGRLRNDYGIGRLLVEGGSELNAALLVRELVDELFLTLAPKVKLGRTTPTYAGGEPLDRGQIQRYALLDVLKVGDELFLRYRRNR